MSIEIPVHMGSESFEECSACLACAACSGCAACAFCGPSPSVAIGLAAAAATDLVMNILRLKPNQQG